MDQLEMSVSDQKIQGLRDRLKGEDDVLQRENENRRRPGRAVEVHRNLIPLLRGEAVPYRLLSTKANTPPGPKGPEPTLRLVFGLATAMLLLTVIGIVACTMLR